MYYIVLLSYWPCHFRHVSCPCFYGVADMVTLLKSYANVAHFVIICKTQVTFLAASCYSFVTILQQNHAEL